MSGEDNIYKYITTEGKVFGEQAKKFTMLEYLQKSTGVFNQHGKYIKRNLAISDRIIRRSLNGLFDSVAELFSPEVNSHSNRLREIEEEIKQQHEQELQEEQQIVNYNKNRWNWGK